MKTFFLLLISFTSLNIYSQQIPNYSFENWESSSGYDEPVDWTTPNSTSYVFPFYVLTVTPSNEYYSGTKSARLETKEIVGIPVPGLLTLGELHVDIFNNSSSISGGIPFISRPSKLRGFMKYSPQPQDSALVGVFMLKYNSGSGVCDTIGLGAYYQSFQTTVFTEFEVNIDYSSTEMPDSMNIIIMSSDVDNPVLGSILHIDELSFDYSSFVEKNTGNKAPVIVNPADDFINIISNGMKIKRVNIYNISGMNRLRIDNIYYERDILLSSAGLSNGRYIIEIVDITNQSFYSHLTILK